MYLGAVKLSGIQAFNFHQKILSAEIAAKVDRWYPDTKLFIDVTANYPVVLAVANIDLDLREFRQCVNVDPVFRLGAFYQRTHISQAFRQLR